MSAASFAKSRMMQPTLRAARRFTRLAVWAPREFIAPSPGAFDTLITKHSRHIFRVFLHLRVFFLSILAPTVFGVRFADRIRKRLRVQVPGTSQPLFKIIGALRSMMIG
jgi:hypothetical protein